jgi:hypothetical protein
MMSVLLFHITDYMMNESKWNRLNLFRRNNLTNSANFIGPVWKDTGIENGDQEEVSSHAFFEEKTI